MTGGSTGSAAPARPICSGRAAASFAGSSSPRPRRISPVSKIRLPDASDLLPPTFARSLLQGARESELSRLPGRRVAGIDAAGLRLTPDAEGNHRRPCRHLGRPGQRAAAAGGAVRRRRAAPGAHHDASSSSASAPLRKRPPTSALPEGVRVDYEQSVDVAAAANAFAPYDLPASLAGLSSRDGEDPGAVGVYGRGPTTLIALPLRGQVARPLRQQLQDRGNARTTDVGTLAPVGPVGIVDHAVSRTWRQLSAGWHGDVRDAAAGSGRAVGAAVTSAAHANGHVIRTRALTKRYGELRAVDRGGPRGPRAGDVYGFLGANGSGKTTTVRMLLGLVLPTSGEAEVLGSQCRPPAEACCRASAHSWRVPPPIHTCPGSANLALLDATGSDRSRRAERRTRIGTALEQVGLNPADRRPVRTYSQGMRQRLGLAAALMRRPTLLILDEPSNGLDPQGIQDIRRLLLQAERRRDDHLSVQPPAC